jgi:hypothetical protein
MNLCISNQEFENIGATQFGVVPHVFGPVSRIQDTRLRQNDWKSESFREAMNLHRGGANLTVSSTVSVLCTRVPWKKHNGISLTDKSLRCCSTSTCIANCSTHRPTWACSCRCAVIANHDLTSGNDLACSHTITLKA